MYVHFNATIASLDTGEVVHNGTLIGGKQFDSSEAGGSPRLFTLGSDVTNKASARLLRRQPLSSPRPAS